MNQTPHVKRAPKTVDGAEVLARFLADPAHAAEYERGLAALRFGVQVCLRREELGLAQKDLEAFGIAQETVSRIERGVRLPDTKTQPKLARALQARIVIEPDGQWRVEPVPALLRAA